MALSDKLKYTKESINAIGEALRHLDLSFDSNQELGEWARFIRNITSIQPWIKEYDTFGKTEQKVTVQGKNLLNIKNSSIEISGLKINILDGILTINGTSTTAVSIKLSNGVIVKTGTPSSDWLNENVASTGEYTFTYYSVSGTTPTTELAYRVVDSKNLYNQIYPVNSGKSSTSFTKVNDISFVYLYINSGLTFDNAMSKLQLQSGLVSTDWEPFVPKSPSPEFPSEMNALGKAEGLTIIPASNQLFDKNNADIRTGVFINVSGVIGRVTGNSLMVLPIKPNTAYTVSKIVSTRMRLGFTNDFSLTSGIQLNGFVVNDAITTLTSTSTSTDNYLVLQYMTTDINEQEILDSIMINEGSTALPWEEYRAEQRIQKGKLIVRSRGKNVITEQGLSTPITNHNFWQTTIFTYATPLEDGWMHFERDNTTATAGYGYINFWTQKNAVKLKENTDYTLLVEIRNVEKIGTPRLILLGGESSTKWIPSIIIPSVEFVDGKKIKLVRTKVEFTDDTYLSMRNYVEVIAGSSISCDIRMMIIEGNHISEDLVYEPFIEPIITEIETEEPLRSLPNGIRDNLDYKYIKEGIINGTVTNNIYAYQLVTSTIGNNLLAVVFNISDKKTNTPLRSNKLQSKILGSTTDTTNTDNVRFFEGIATNTTIGSTQVIISLLRSRLEEESLAGILKFLQNNPILAQYELAEPIPQNIERPELPYFGVAPELLNEVQGEIQWTLDGVTHSTVIENE